MLAAAMEAVLALIGTARPLGSSQPLHGPAVPEPRHLTDAYAQLIVADGFAALGDMRAREVRDAAIQTLRDVEQDPVHAYLAAVFSARIDQTCAGLARDTPLPAHLDVQRGALDR